MTDVVLGHPTIFPWFHAFFFPRFQQAFGANLGQELGPPINIYKPVTPYEA